MHGHLLVCYDALAMPMRTSKLFYPVIVLAALLLGAGGYVAYQNLVTPMTPFENAAYRISFSYPGNYAVEERDTPGRHTIVLTDKEALAAAPQNGEGPTAITFDVFENPQGLSPEQWVRTNPASNFQLSPNQQLATATQGGAESVAYQWDGLYRGESYVFENGTEIVMASVTVLTPEDQIRRDFERILRTLVLAE